MDKMKQDADVNEFGWTDEARLPLERNGEPLTPEQEAMVRAMRSLPKGLRDVLTFDARKRGFVAGRDLREAVSQAAYWKRSDAGEGTVMATSGSQAEIVDDSADEA